MRTPIDSSRQARLWQLISAQKPVGAFHHSQGLEEAVAEGRVACESSVLGWLRALLQRTVCRVDLPIVARARAAWSVRDAPALMRWDALCRACRETSELRAEERNMGTALLALMRGLGDPVPGPALGYATAFGVAAANIALTERETLAGYAWAWCENQTACAIRLVPLGHVAGQRVLRDLGDCLAAVVQDSLTLADDEIGISAPGLAILSARHESRATRLFRS